MKKITDMICKKLKTDKKTAVLLIIGAAGIIILVLSELLPFGRASPEQAVQEQTDAASCSEYEQDMERRLGELISQIDGAGKVKVMVTLDCTDESTWATEEKDQISDNSSSHETKYIIVKSDGSESGVLVKVTQPQVRGVLPALSR